MNIIYKFYLKIELNTRQSDKYGEITNLHFKDENLKNILTNKIIPEFDDLDMFLKCLALCHTVIVDRDHFKNIEYHASSIDEKALVNGSRYLNYIYKEKDINDIITLEIMNQDYKYKLLQVIEFDSKRKRMTVIVKDLSSGKIILFIKGSDTILRALTSKNLEYLRVNEIHLNDFCSLGLRSFNVGYKYLEEDEFNKWNEIYKVNFFCNFFFSNF